MSIYTWDEALETGNEQIDEQHKSLFALAEKLADASGAIDDDDFVSDAIYRLTDYVVEHFTSEELLMSFVEYPGMGPHVAQHEYLTGETIKLTSRYFAGEPLAASEIAELVATWMRDHILAEDRRVAEHIASHR